jgi:hypothetical protein
LARHSTPTAPGLTFGNVVQSWPQAPQFLGSLAEPQGASAGVSWATSDEASDEAPLVVRPPAPALPSGAMLERPPAPEAPPLARPPSVLCS